MLGKQTNTELHPHLLTALNPENPRKIQPSKPTRPICKFCTQGYSILRFLFLPPGSLFKIDHDPVNGVNETHASSQQKPYCAQSK
jgi:hypothetical protein